MRCRFLKTAGKLDQRTDLAEPNWMIDLVFEVGAIPKGVDWTTVGRRLEEWFIAIRPTLRAGRAVYEVGSLPFSLKVTVDKSALPDTPGCLFVMRTMPKETVEPVLRAALCAKLPKLAATPGSERILLLELESPTRGNWEIGQTIEDIHADFPAIGAISSIWLAKTTGWETDGYIGFHLIWPLHHVEQHQEWWKARPNERLHSTAATLESGRGRG